MTNERQDRAGGRNLAHSALRPVLPVGIAVSAGVVTGSFAFLAMALGGFSWLAARNRELA